MRSVADIVHVVDNKSGDLPRDLLLVLVVCSQDGPLPDHPVESASGVGLGIGLERAREAAVLVDVRELQFSTQVSSPKRVTLLVVTQQMNALMLGMSLRGSAAEDVVATHRTHGTAVAVITAVTVSPVMRSLRVPHVQLNRLEPIVEIVDEEVTLEELLKR